MKTIIFDIDGTLADLTHRREHVQQRPKRWDKFFESLHLDTPIQNVVDLCQHFLDDASVRVVFCTGRGEEYRAVTEKWLEDHVTQGSVVVSDVLFMRPARDHRPDDVIKQEMLDRLRAEGHDIWFVVDDRQRVVDMWRKNGITVLQCAPGDFDNAEPAAYQPKPHERLLTLMIGPSGAGKSSWLKHNIDEHNILSSDATRLMMFGDFRDQSDNGRVFGYIHEAAQARLKYGLYTVIDATHLHKKDRMASVNLAPKGTVVEYVVIDRPLFNKLRDGGWRLGVVMKDGKNLVEYHHHVFQSVRKDVLNGDGLPNVRVIDLTK